MVRRDVLEAYLINKKAPVEVCHAYRDLVQEIKDMQAYNDTNSKIVEGRLDTMIDWLINNLDRKALIDLAVKARDEYTALETFAGATTLEATLEAFTLRINEEFDGCDHEAGICNCDLRFALNGEPPEPTPPPQPPGYTLR